MLSTVKVPCDPAQVIVNHVSFRVQFATPPPVSRLVMERTPLRTPTAVLPRVPAMAGGAAPPAVVPRRRRPVVWSGRAAPGDAAATALLRAVQAAALPADDPDATTTQLLPRGGAALAVPAGGARREPESSETTQVLRVPGGAGLLPPAPASGGGLAGPGVHRGDHPDHGLHDDHDDWPGTEDDTREDLETGYDDGRAEEVRRPDGRHAYYPGRGLNLGIVLLPLRILLGTMSLYAGMGKLTDPVYFDGGERGSMVTWLSSLEPWAPAAPLHDWALSHPVGAGLTVAFVQIIVGVLTICGLWQRFGAALGALLSLALLMTVSGQGPAYDMPDLILLAAWSPLIIAGAPAYSLDARLASEAWRTLGPRAPLAGLRRRVLRRGLVLATVLVGLALLIGSVLGGAVRSAYYPSSTRPGELPRNSLPGELLPDSADEEADEATAPTVGPDGEDAPAEETAAPSAEERGAAEGRESAGATEGPTERAPEPEQTVQVPQQQPALPPERSAPPAPPPPGTGGGSPGGAAGGEESATVDDGPAEDGSGGDSGSRNPIGGLLG
ncbi:DoxX family membrane protein [Streptomyces sp. ACA25]|uniref:DoxX family protein n=1 Tax=Streptomyces sp. ACA25 TaxID=3022596 RepID=UPI0023071BC6|nr:DoxX family membrane protein [Streptomyces sp. ACA25]MDB1088019.1 DoxX family membrane protein [Streptomyces sp. ACA25]